MVRVPWRRQIALYCFGCGRERLPDERFSARGKCEKCGDGAMLANANELREHRGEYFDHWRRRCLAAFGVTLDE